MGAGKADEGASSVVGEANGRFFSWFLFASAVILPVTIITYTRMPLWCLRSTIYCVVTWERRNPGDLTWNHSVTPGISYACEKQQK